MFDLNVTTGSPEPLIVTFERSGDKFGPRPEAADPPGLPQPLSTRVSERKQVSIARIMRYKEQSLYQII